MEMNTKINLPSVKMREFEEIRIPVPWGYIAGRWYGKKNVRPILALHGWLDNYGTWDTLMPLMPPHIAVLAIDMPGHGESSRLPDGVPYHAHSYLADIIRVMQHYNWNKVSFMAHSMCSMIAFVFAAYYPDRVDMLIHLDAFHPHYLSPEQIILYMNGLNEIFLIEEKRIRETYFREQPSYPYEEVIRRVHEGSNQSVDKDKCVHLIRPSVTKSTLYPSKYYFSRDPRLKSFVGFFYSFDYMVALCKRIKIPQLVIKASGSNLIEEDDPLIDVLRHNNPYFEFHILEGTHHVHLNNAPETSILVNTFINKWKKPQADNTDNVNDDDDDDVVPENGDGVKPQPQICPMNPQGLKLLQKAKL